MAGLSKSTVPLLRLTADFHRERQKTTTDYVAFSLVGKQNAAVAVVEPRLDYVIVPLQSRKTVIKEGENAPLTLTSCPLAATARSSF